MLRRSKDKGLKVIRILGCICFLAILCQSAYLMVGSAFSKLSYTSAAKVKKDFRSEFAGGADAVLSVSFGIRPPPAAAPLLGAGRTENLRLWPFAGFEQTRSPPPAAAL